MAIDPDYLLNREWPKITQTYTEKDCMLYALGVGMGMDPQVYLKAGDLVELGIDQLGSSTQKVVPAV